MKRRRRRIYMRWRNVITSIAPRVLSRILVLVMQMSFILIGSIAVIDWGQREINRRVAAQLYNTCMEAKLHSGKMPVSMQKALCKPYPVNEIRKYLSSQQLM